MKGWDHRSFDIFNNLKDRKNSEHFKIGGDESGKTFVVVGTDMSGNAQTETITGPGANATVLGSKTFKTISSITPSADTTGNVTMGVTGAFETTTGVDGSATLDSVAMIADVTNNFFTISNY